MIRIDKIEIREFRGIRDLKIDFKQKNFGICGPNGTGKSGVVDAIEFALTGDITRLSGAGSAELSVKAHAPHVDAQTKPEKSFVKIITHAPLLNKKITIQRNVKEASTPIITPSDKAVSDIVSQLGAHPEFALSRREIVKYILTPAGQRSKDVQTLLQLDQIEKLRQSLQKIANQSTKKFKQAIDDDARIQTDFLKHLGIPQLSKKDLLASVNRRRAVLQLPPLDSLDVKTSLKEGVTKAGGETTAATKISKTSALADIASFKDTLMETAQAPFSQAVDESLQRLEALQHNPEALRSFRQQVLIEQGLELLEDDSCPLCDQAWDVNELKLHLEQKVARASVAKEQITKLRDAVFPISKSLAEILVRAGKIVALCGLTEPKTSCEALVSFGSAVKLCKETLESVITDPSLVGSAIQATKEKKWVATEAINKVITAISDYIDLLPEPSKENEARDFLSVAQEKYDQFRNAKQSVKQAEEKVVFVDAVLAQYSNTSKRILEGIYDAVQKDFTEYYRLINHDDEGKFEGSLTPSFNKLAFDVDFYGRGKYPPGAYHSEGHQDGMGLCLYLALMKHTLGDNFTFAVLDDVLMSVDVGHRREVCTLFKTKFPKTQFILTTHDPVWLQFMRTENLVQSSLRFSGWNVDVGPQVWDDRDVWEEIEVVLQKGNVNTASSTLRRYLEYVMTVLAHNLRASVEFHGDGQYDLGDLLPPVLTRLKSLMSTAKGATKSWGVEMGPIEAFEKVTSGKIAKTHAEQWMINKALHYNSWANLQPSEFRTVVDAYKDLLATIQCVNVECLEFLYVAPRKGEKESLRCGCGTINFVLKSK